jgi:ribosome biogenesis GTPase
MNLDSFPESWGWQGYVYGRLARVIHQEKGLYQIQISESESLTAQLSGKLQHEITDPLAYPSVGDWVYFTHQDLDERALIHQVTERRTCFYRGREQVVASNIDTVLIVSSANGELNLNRLDRYLTIAWDSGATPVIVLSKTDLCKNIAETVAGIEARHPAVKVCPISMNDRTSLQGLDEYLKSAKTVVLLGSSGVGKSTLTNALMQAEIAETSAISRDEQRGRHTTTSRQLYRLPNGALLIDTPGMRSLALGDHEEGLVRQFAEITALFSRCRFSNCQHQTEPNCAILLALETKALDRAQWESYQKLQREILFQKMKEDPVLKRQETQKWKKRGAEGRARQKMKRQTF